MMNEKENQIVRSSAAEYLTFVAASGYSEISVEMRYENENIWLTQKMMATLYDVSIPAINQHLKRIFADNELTREATIKKYLIVQTEGNRQVKRAVDHYNLQAIIAVGFKIENERAVQFRKWANQIVKDYTIQGWTMDAERLKHGGTLTDEFFERQLEKIREIRLSERKFYQKITDIYATALDYDPSATATKRFFAAVQNKMHFAVHGNTAAEVIKKHMGTGKKLKNFAGWGNSHGNQLVDNIHLPCFFYNRRCQMPRIARFVRSDIPTVYHVISRTALDGFPLEKPEKDYLLGLIRRLSRFYFVDVLGFCIMSNHFHLVTRMYTENHFSDDQVRERLERWLPEGREISEQTISQFRKRWSSLATFVKDIKQGFTRYYNKRHGRKGYFWGDRFKSLIVQNGRSLINLLAYVDLNPIRAGIVKRPEQYRWCSLGYHVQTANRDGLLCMDFGMKEWNEHDPTQIVRKYRQFVYETGAVDTGKGKTMDPKILNRERKKNFEMKRFELFCYRTRYFSDAGILGSKEFVQEVFDQVKHLLQSKDERKFTSLAGAQGVYSMKRLRT